MMVSFFVRRASSTALFGDRRRSGAALGAEEDVRHTVGAGVRGVATGGRPPNRP